MPNKFNFKLLTSSDPQAQYDAIETKDNMTFYLLKNGIGYLGSIKLFDANADDYTDKRNPFESDLSGRVIFVLTRVKYFPKSVALEVLEIPRML